MSGSLLFPELPPFSGRQLRVFLQSVTVQAWRMTGLRTSLRPTAVTRVVVDGDVDGRFRGASLDSKQAPGGKYHIPCSRNPENRVNERDWLLAGFFIETKTACLSI